jgi:tetratricopeptide (TPR) repeat protein
MGRKLTREQLRRDEVMDTVGRGWNYVSAHRRGTIKAAAAVAGAAVLVFAFFAVQSSRNQRAQEHLSKALTILASPLASEPAGPESTGRTYATEAERSSEAERELKAAAEVSGTPAARDARIVLAARGKESDAISPLRRAARGRSPIAALAGLDVVRVLESQGKTAEATAELKRELASSSPSTPKDVLLFELGSIYEASGSPADARASYQRILDECPQSPLRGEAQTKISSL